ncbi:MAG: carboxypeptidase-like regulatory domain-containing protein, partial [Planctomycetota bacterium]
SIQITFGGEAGFFSFGKSHPRTNDQGIYEIPELAPGDWMVTLRHPDYQERTFMVSGLQPGSTTTVATQRLDLVPDSAQN